MLGLKSKYQLKKPKKYRKNKYINTILDNILTSLKDKYKIWTRWMSEVLPSLHFFYNARSVEKF